MWKGGKNAVLQDINIPALAACVEHALTTSGGPIYNFTLTRVNVDFIRFGMETEKLLL